MTMKAYPHGVWPVMLTPFTAAGQVDEQGLFDLTRWYISQGVNGLFAACQSSEIFTLSLAERVRLVEITVQAAAGQVPVIASGHVSDDMQAQIEEVQAIHAAGAEAVVLISNRFARQDESEVDWLCNFDRFLAAIPSNIKLGMYECPHPYKRLMTPAMLKACMESGRFAFMKDTCCDAAMLKERLELLAGSSMNLYNANTTTLLDSLLDGAAGYSGVMAGFHPELYVWLCQNAHHPSACKVQDLLSVMACVERQCYPVNAKFHLKAIEGLNITTYSRVQDERLLASAFKADVYSMERVAMDTYHRYCEKE